LAASIEMTQSVPPPHREGVAPLQPRDYDGKFVVTHTVQHGQTLTKIAAIYLFPRWEPIWIYNTKVERVLGDNPDVIRTGVTIFIPRSRDGYDALIKTRQLARSPTSCSTISSLVSSPTVIFS
jgi:nucleoid-associated protein YgaU